MCSSEVSGLLKEKTLYLTDGLGVDNFPLAGLGGLKGGITFKIVSRESINVNSETVDG